MTYSDVMYTFIDMQLHKAWAIVVQHSKFTVDKID